MRLFMRAGSNTLFLLVLMFAGSLILWIGVPLLWLYIGSQIQANTQSVAAALGAMAIGVALSIGVMVRLLSWLNVKHIELREARGLESYGQTPLEGAMSISAGIALVGFCIWFFLFSGSSPVPVNISF